MVTQLRGDLGAQLLHPLLLLQACHPPRQPRRQGLAVQPHGSLQERAQVELAHDPVLVVPLRARDLAFTQAAVGADHLRGELAHARPGVAAQQRDQPGQQVLRRRGLAVRPGGSIIVRRRQRRLPAGAAAGGAAFQGREQEVEGGMEGGDVRGPLDQGDLQPPAELAPVKQVGVTDSAQGVGRLWD